MSNAALNDPNTVLGMSVPRALGAAVVAMVVAAVGVGLILAGSPIAQREARFDAQRVNDLRQIASAVDLYAHTNDALPETLDDLVRPEIARLYYLRAITDPETGEPYGYAAMGDASYQLCATFTRASDDAADAALNDPYNKVWHHPAGEHCFDLAVPPRPQVGDVPLMR